MGTRTNLTILIVTKNNYSYIDRQFSYYLKNDYSFRFLIADSSEPEEKSKLLRVITKYSDRLDITLVDCGNRNVVQAVHLVIPMISTPYSIAVADGGLLLKKGLLMLMDYLDRNEGIHVVNGKVLAFAIEETGIGHFYGTLAVRMETSAIERTQNYIESYGVTMYCMVRTSVWQKAWNFKYSDSIKASFMKNDSFFGEILPGVGLVMQSRVSYIETPYLIRHIHNKRKALPTSRDLVENLKTDEEIRKSAIAFLEKVVFSLKMEKDVASDIFVFLQHRLEQNASNEFERNKLPIPLKKKDFFGKRTLRKILRSVKRLLLESEFKKGLHHILNYKPE